LHFRFIYSLTAFFHCLCPFSLLLLTYSVTKMNFFSSIEYCWYFWYWTDLLEKSGGNNFFS
jgi:hypothetical protein